MRIRIQSNGAPGGTVITQDNGVPFPIEISEAHIDITAKDGVHAVLSTRLFGEFDLEASGDLTLLASGKVKSVKRLEFTDGTIWENV